MSNPPIAPGATDTPYTVFNDAPVGLFIFLSSVTRPPVNLQVNEAAPARRAE